MNPKASISVFAVIVLLTLCPLVSTVEDTGLGVTAGDFATYSAGSFWKTNQTGVTLPLALVGFENVTSIKYEILNVTEQTVQYTITKFYSNSTSKSITYTGNFQKLGIIIPANQTASGILNVTGTITHNDTLTRTYGNSGTQRLVNRLEFTQKIDNNTQLLTSTFWDNQTGLNTETYLNYTALVGGNLSSWSIYQVISDTSLFEIANPSTGGLVLSPTIIAAVACVGVVVPVAVVGVFFLRKRKRKPKSQEVPLQTPDPYQTPTGTFTPPPYYYEHPYYRKPYVSRYKSPKNQPRFSSYTASLYQKPPSNYTRPGTSTRKCPNCQGIVDASETYCPNCNKRLW